MNEGSVLKDISLIIRTSETTPISEATLVQWFDSLGGKPGEVVLIDRGSSFEVQETYWMLFHKQLIDKVQVSQPGYALEAEQQEHVYLYTQASLSSKPYLFWLDSSISALPNSSWLEEAVAYLDQDKVMAVTGLPEALRESVEAGEGWFYNRSCDLSFTLMKRSTFMAAMHEYADAYIVSGFTTSNPATSVGQGKEMVAIALQQYLECHGLYSLSPKEGNSVLQTSALQSVVG